MEVPAPAIVFSFLNELAEEEECEVLAMQMDLTYQQIHLKVLIRQFQ